MIADRVNNLYYARENTKNVKNSTCDSVLMSCIESNVKLRHYRVGHLNLKDLYECQRIIQGVNFKGTDNNYTLECDIFSKGKMTSLSFPKKSDRVNAPLEIIHRRLWSNAHRIKWKGEILCSVYR